MKPSESLEKDVAELERRLSDMERQMKTLTRELDMAHWTSVENVLTARDKYAVIAEACCQYFGVPKTEVYIKRRVGGDRSKKDNLYDKRTRVRSCLCLILMYDFGFMRSELVSQFGQNVKYYATQWYAAYEKVFYSDKPLDAEERALMDDMVAIYRLSTKMLDERGHGQAASHLRGTTADKRMTYAR